LSDKITLASLASSRKKIIKAIACHINVQSNKRHCNRGEAISNEQLLAGARAIQHLNAGA
jgi:hypothetical protein